MSGAAPTPWWAAGPPVGRAGYVSVGPDGPAVLARSLADLPDPARELTAPGSDPLAARLPEQVARVLVDLPGQDEEQVRQPVQVLRGQRVHGGGVDLQRCPGRPLGPPHHGAGHMEQRRGGRAAGQDETAQQRQALLELTAGLLPPA